MTYTVLSTENLGDTLKVTVQYDFLTTPTEVMVFMPTSIDDVNTALTNRGASEQAKLTAMETIATLIPTIEVGVAVEV